MRCRVSVGCALWCVAVGHLATAPTARAAEPTGRVVGRVTDDAGAPVGGVMVSALARPALTPADVLLRRATSDPDGNYELLLPRGHVQMPGARPPAGYYAEMSLVEIGTSAAQPTITHDVRVKRGGAITLVLEAELADKGNQVSISRSQGAPYFYLAQGTESGRAAITIPADGGTFGLYVRTATHFKQLAKVELELAPGFVTEPLPEFTPGPADEQHVIVDRDGRKATVAGAVPSVIDGRLALRVLPNPKSDKRRTVRIVGQVLDENDKPINAATVRFGAAFKGGGSSSALATQSAADGTFVLEPTIHDGTGAQAPYYFLIVTAAGTAGSVTKSKLVPRDKDTIEAEPVRLSPGHFAKVRVVDEQGLGVEGAWVQPGDAYLSTANFARTDNQGCCVVNNLPAGIVRVEARFGQTYAQQKIVVEDNIAGEPVVLRLQSRAKLQAASANPFPPTPPVGSPAPEWKLVGWSDGQPRTLADYRGKVVVLDFWGTWCSACLNGLGAIKQLQARYADNPSVVFLGIHSAGTDMQQVQAVLRLKEWELPTGLDMGSDVLDGAMARAYGAKLWPTKVIIDREGKIAHNSNLEEWNAAKIVLEHGRIAKALDLPPENPSATFAEHVERSNRMNAFRYGELIDKQLADKKSD